MIEQFVAERRTHRPTANSALYSAELSNASVVAEVENLCDWESDMDGLDVDLSDFHDDNPSSSFFFIGEDARGTEDGRSVDNEGIYHSIHSPSALDVCSDTPLTELSMKEGDEDLPHSALPRKRIQFTNASHGIAGEELRRWPVAGVNPRKEFRREGL
ncbi:hypothetical protein EW145_g1340 [Phellinidium pouzarii]|uniref:Uncharacterized protein n=1 Tax=Phellinidium pouzarii TaxID=167371 RepID=A0A4S4LEZ5_9AGAM|nr:hypothetical protein EW145_g1340 [Phellinidium pouzarii]